MKHGSTLVSAVRARSSRSWSSAASALRERRRPLLERLASLPLRQLESALPRYSQAEIRAACACDPWLGNYVMSAWEKSTGQAVVESYPWHQALAITDTCNAKCPFCTSWLATRGMMDMETLPALRRLMRHARVLIVSGVGEPTIHPHFGAIMDFVRETLDPRATQCLITNGDRILKLQSVFECIPMVVSVSLNAATAETHDRIMKMGPDSFTRVLDGIRFLVALGRTVMVNFVVTNENIEELPRFIAMADELGVAHVFLHTLTPMATEFRVALDYHRLPPILHPRFEELREEAVRAIEQARVPVVANPSQWGLELEEYALSRSLDSPSLLASFNAGEKYDGKANQVMTLGGPLSAEAAALDPGFSETGDPFGHRAPYACDYVYYSSSLLNQDMALKPCCFMSHVPGFEEMGYLATENFHELWNSAGMVTLRRRLQSGPLYAACKTCTVQLAY